jgi:hypothetical protein
MHALFLLILLQAQTPFPGPVNLAAPHGQAFPKQTTTEPVQLAKPGKNTTPSLSIDSDLLTHYEIGIDVGAQREAVGELRSRVVTLEDKREKTDRPDIDSLESSRNYAIWTWSVLGTVFVTLAGVIGFFRKHIWNDSIKPRLKKELVEYP